MTSAIDLDDDLQLSDSVEFREIEGAPVLFNIETGRYFGLEGIAVEIWHGIEEGLSPRRVAERICESYEVPLEQCQKDVVQFAQSLCNAGLLEIVSA